MCSKMRSKIDQNNIGCGGRQPPLVARSILPRITYSSHRCRRRSKHQVSFLLPGSNFRPAMTSDRASQKDAAPPRAGRENLGGYSNGTSAAASLASQTCHRIDRRPLARISTPWSLRPSTVVAIAKLPENLRQTRSRRSGENWEGATQETLARIARIKDVHRSRGRVQHGDR